MSYVRVIVSTQDMKNKGDELNPCWRPDGGSDYVVAAISIEEAAKGAQYIQETYVDPVLDKIEIDNEFFQSYVIDWNLFFEGELTWFEKSQLEYDGVIDHAPGVRGQGGDGPWCPIWAKSVCELAEFPRAY